MSGQPPNVWQTTSRARPSHSASRTPQNRSSNASPAPPTTSAQLPRQAQPVNSVWAQRSMAATNNAGGSTSTAGVSSTSNGQPKGPAPAVSEDGQQHSPVNGFNAAEVKMFLGRHPAGMVYKVPDVPGAGKGAGGAAWGVKGKANLGRMDDAKQLTPVLAGNTASNQPFFGQLAKQIAMLEGGG
nr:hypothetical protein CFP56_09404 [Quercus suber]